MSFDDTGAEPDQEFELQPDRTGILEYTTRFVMVFYHISGFALFLHTLFIKLMPFF